MTDGGYRGNPEVIMPYQKSADRSELPEWKEELNAVHRSGRAHPGSHEVLGKSSANIAAPPAHWPH
jgi:hypothetical protein